MTTEERLKELERQMTSAGRRIRWLVGSIVLTVLILGAFVFFRDARLEKRRWWQKEYALADAISPAWLCTYTSRVEAIDVDTRNAMTVTVTPFFENRISSFKVTEMGSAMLQVEFCYNLSKAWGTNLPPAVFVAKGPHNEHAIIHLAGTNDLVMAYMVANEPTVLKWRNEQYSHIFEAIEKSDTNEVRRILLTGDYFAKFKETYWYEKEEHIESKYITWRQLAAIEAAAKQPTLFGNILVEYYFGSLETAGKMTGEEQIKAASLKQIEQGKLYDEILGAGKNAYKIGLITYRDSQTAIVAADFNVPFAGRGYRLVFKTFTINGVTLWLPVKKDQTCVS